MPRHKEYCRDAVLEQAMNVFWRKGYEGTSMQDLVDATRLNRFGMYKAFGNKEGLFLAVLDKYLDQVGGRVLAILREEPRGLKSIKNLFHMFLEGSSKPNCVKGCLVTNTAIDLPSVGKGVANRVRKQFKRLEDGFFACLAGAVQSGEIGPKSDLKAMASYLVGITQGFSVLARANVDKAQLQSFVKVALGNLAGGK